MRRAEPGFTLLETLVVVSLVALTAALLYGALAVQLRLARAANQRVLEADAVRTAAAILGGELRRTAARDIRAVAAESLALRAFRGSAIVCNVTAAGILVRYAGDRLPEPAKDSALWIDTAQVTPVRIDAVGRDSAACAMAGPDPVQIWRTSPPVTGRGLLLVFESGAYHLADRALRYRLGAAGRQPITAELFQAGTRFDAADSSAVRLRLRTAAGSPVPLVLHHGVPAAADSLLPLETP